MNLEDGFLTIDEVAEILGTTYRHVQTLMYRAGLPYLKLSKRAVRIDPADLEDWLADHRVQREVVS